MLEIVNEKWEITKKAQKRRKFWKKWLKLYPFLAGERQELERAARRVRETNNEF